MDDKVVKSESICIRLELNNRCRTIAIGQEDGTQKHLLFPFLINTGGTVMIGAETFNRCPEAGARTGTSVIAEQTLKNASMIMPSDPAFKGLRSVSSGHWFDQQPDIRNNIIGSSFASMIVSIQVSADLVRNGQLSKENALASLSRVYPGHEPEDFAAELDLQLASPLANTIDEAVEKL